MTITEKQNAYILDFQKLTDWFDKYAYLIELAGVMDPMPSLEKSDEHLIKRCQSKTWLTHTYLNGKLYFQVDSDALIVKGVLGIIADILSGKSPQEVSEANLFILDVIDFDDNVPHSRSNGVRESIDTMINIGHTYDREREDSKRIKSP